MKTTMHYLTIDGWVEAEGAPPAAFASFERTFATMGHNGVPVIDYSLAWKSPAVSVGELEDALDEHGMLEMNVSASIADVSWDMSWAM